MPAKAPLLRFSIVLWILFAFAAPQNSARAQEATPDPKATLKMALSSPFALTAKPLLLLAKRGKWFPVAVTLTNSGDPLEGEARLKILTSGEDPANDFVAKVDLPTNARKVVWLYGRLERPNVNAIEVSFSGRGFKALSERVPLQEPNEGQRVILTVSDADSGLSEALRGLRGSGLALSETVNPTGFVPPQNGSQGPLRPLETAREGVPDRWIGMEIADLLILGDFPHTALAPPQIESLRGFVAGGGNLLALGGTNAQRLAASPLADLWPATIGSSAAASASETRKIVDAALPPTPRARPRTGADNLGGSPLVVARGKLKTGAQLKLGNALSPLSAYSDSGAGRVLLLMFDPSQPPFNGWSGQIGLWREVFGASVQARALEGLDSEFAGTGPPNFGGNASSGTQFGFNNGQNDTLTAQLLRALGTAQQRSTPPVSQIAWFLALYVFVLVPLNYSVLRFIDRRELAWISIPAIVAAFSFFAYSYALNIRGKQILTRQVDIVQSSIGSPQARTDSLLWLFSPRTTTYTLESGVSNAAISDYATKEGVEQGTFSVIQPVEASSFRAQNAPVRIWVDRSFSAQSVLGLKKGITRVGNTVQNGTPFDLTGAVWVQDSQTRSLGTLKSGASLPIPPQVTGSASGPDLLGAIESASNLDTTIGGETQKNGIPDRALRLALGEGFGRQTEGAFLIGWSKKAAAPLSIGTSGAQASDLTLFVFRADAFPTARAGNQVAGREAIVRLARTEPLPNLQLGAVDATGGGVTYYECLLPGATRFEVAARGVGGGGGGTPQFRPRPGFQGDEAYVIPRGNLPAWVHFEVFDARQNRWKPLSGSLRRDDSPTGGWNFTASVGSEMARQPDRMLKIRVRRDSARARIASLRVTAE